MMRLRPLAPLLLVAATASCGAEPLVVESPPPVVVALELPAAPSETPPRQAERAPLAVAVTVAAEPVPFHCGGGTLIVAGDRPYCLQTSPATFEGSERWCASNGGHLARIGSDQESQALHLALGSPIGFDGGAWFGLVSPRPGQWLWSTGAPVIVESWGPGEPNNAGGDESCGEVYAHSALWNDLSCARRLPYVCESRPARPGAVPGKLRCQGTSFHAGGRPGGIDYCYEPGQSVPWIDAEHACKSAGGTLASLTTPEEIEAFRAAVADRLGADRAWIGFTDEGHEGHWTSVTGRPMTYSHWRAGEPNNAGGRENCAEWYPSDAGWNDVPCELPHVGICTPG